MRVDFDCICNYNWAEYTVRSANPCEMTNHLKMFVSVVVIVCCLPQNSHVCACNTWTQLCGLCLSYDAFESSVCFFQRKWGETLLFCLKRSYILYNNHYNRCPYRFLSLTTTISLRVTRIKFVWLQTSNVSVCPDTSKIFTPQYYCMNSTWTNDFSFWRLIVKRKRLFNRYLSCVCTCSNIKNINQLISIDF